MHVVQVLNSKSEPVLSNETSMVEREAERIRDIERELEEVKSLIEKEHISCETHLLVHGLSPGEDLVQFANESAIDFIFMGIRRRSKVGKLIFGSTAQYVILNAPCPVVTIK
jgi:nucleotide-binding universal stress UspA family protein